LAGLLFDRFGPVRLYLVGLGALGFGLSSAAFANSLWQFYLLLGLAGGFATIALGTVPHSALLSRWFRKRLSTATSVVYCSTGAGVLIMVPLAQLLVDHFGWRNTYHWLGAAALALVPLLLLLPWRRMAAGIPYEELPAAQSEPLTTDSDWTLRRAMRSTPFWGLFAVFFFTAQGNIAISVQGVAFLVDAGFEPIQAASAWGFTGLLAPIGMLGCGWLDDVVGRRITVALSYGFSLCAVVAMWVLYHHPTFLLMMLFVGLFGSTLGSRGPLVSTLTTQLFRGRDLGTIFGGIALGGGIGSALGSYLGGVLHVWTGGYDMVAVFAFVSLCCGWLPFWTIKELRED
jgi:MFS family permease